ncbi:peptidase domain-containing ABC transporter [Bacteroidota bacterium]
MRRIRAIKQLDQSDCGVACLCSIARSFGYHIPLSKMRELAFTERSGTNVLGLVEAGEKMGFFAKGIKGPPQALRSAPLPCIAHLKVDRNLFHFVVLTWVGKRYVKYMDPESGSFKKVPYETFIENWTGVLIIFAPGPGFKKQNHNASLSARFLKLVRPFRRTITQALLGAVLYSLLGLSTSLFVQKIMDFVLVNRNLNLLNLMGLAMMSLLLIRILISWFKSLYLLKVGHQVDAGLVLGYYRHLLSLPQRFFDTMRTGEILSRMNDAIKIRVFINHTLIELIVAVLTILLTLLAMALLSFQLCMLVASALPLYALLYFIFDRINKTVLRKLMEETAGLESQLVESVQTQRTIRAFGWKAYAYDRTALKFTSVLKMNYKAGIASTVFGHAGELVAGALTILLLWNGAIQVIEGLLSPGELMSFYAMLGYLLGPIRNLGGMNRTIRDAIIAADRLFQILDLDHEKNTDSGIRVNSINRNIEFCNINFRYGARPELFRELSFSIPFGKLTGIVGKSGCGKSSIAAMLRADYLPQDGSLLINDCEIRQLNKVSLRRKIGLVPQYIELFSGSILENIAPGESGADTEKLVRLAYQTGLSHLIKQLPEGFYTEVGEHGLDLSGGERQRIAFARALYQEPDMLILDEATSALDPVSEAEIFKLVNELRKDSMTLLVISHKLSLVKNADHIILIDKGRAIESGRHDDLIQLNGLYHHIWSVQNPIS